LLWVGGNEIGEDRPNDRSPFDFGSDATVGLATVVQIAGELMGGATVLLEHGNHTEPPRLCDSWSRSNT
jgi:hypothetical protein